jgi:hypothetical protein
MPPVSNGAMGSVVRWAVVGTGGIARRTIGDLKICANAELAAVCSRDQAKAMLSLASMESRSRLATLPSSAPPRRSTRSTSELHGMKPRPSWASRHASGVCGKRCTLRAARDRSDSGRHGKDHHRGLHARRTLGGLPGVQLRSATLTAGAGRPPTLLHSCRPGCVRAAFRPLDGRRRCWPCEFSGGVGEGVIGGEKKTWW